MNGYIAFYNGQRLEIRAPSIYAATVAALEEFQKRAGRRKVNKMLVSVVLAEKDGQPVIHDPAILPGA